MSHFRHDRTVIGYHGCLREKGEAVIHDGASLPASEKKFDWLGKGIYFWEYGYDRAWRWAEAQAERRNQRTRSSEAEPYVVGAVIQLANCLDLVDTQAIQLLGGWYEDLVKSYGEQGEPLPSNRHTEDGEPDPDGWKRYLDCAVINLGINNLERAIGLREDQHYYETVRGVFIEGERAFKGSGFNTLTHTQIAVRNPSCILGYFKP